MEIVKKSTVGDVDRNYTVVEAGKDLTIEDILEAYDHLSAVIEETFKVDEGKDSILSAMGITGEQFRNSEYGQQIQSFLAYM